MINLELYDSQPPTIVIDRDPGSDIGAWSRISEGFARGISGGHQNRILVSAEVFLSELEVLREVQRRFATDLVYGANLRARLQGMAKDRTERQNALDLDDNPEEIYIELRGTDYSLELKDFQKRNLSRIVALPHAADFSVPGAGKTAVALANFAILKSRGQVDRMLVVAPIAAFASWKEESRHCFHNPLRVDVHIGADQVLPTTSDILLTNYHRLVSDYDRLSAWVRMRPTQVVLDEAHRIKQGQSGVHGQAALNLAFSAVRRDILTGTPAPQGAHDIVALIGFLYPGQAAQILPQEAFVERLGRRDTVLSETHDAIRKYFVRTRKSELALPRTTLNVVSRAMGPVQSAIYQGLIGRYRGNFQLQTTSRRELRRLGTIVMYLLEAATNPLLLNAGSDNNDLDTFEHPPLEISGDEHLSDLLARYAEYETPWKYEETRRLVAEANTRGEKLLVWSNFVRNIRYLEQMLSEWNPAVVHGGIPPIDSASASTSRIREHELDRFRHDPDCTVLLANPAACGEGVSLHHWCHHAVYLDRTFNAGHFLQSQDRIHRLGLPEETETQFTLLISDQTIDNAVGDRVREKIIALGRLMDDPGLVQLALPEDGIAEVVDASSEASIFSEWFDHNDALSILGHVNQQPS